MNVLVTGAKGFIGSALCYKLSLDNKVIGVDIAKTHDGNAGIAWEQADLTHFNSVAAICEKYSPDVVIHCAGIAHQKIGTVSLDTYMCVNSEATENLAKAAAESNPDVSFIFLSSVSVYGEGPQMTSRKGAKTLRGKKYPQITQISQKEKDVSRPSTICRPCPGNSTGTYGVDKGAPVRSSGLVPAIPRGPTGQAKAQKRKNSSSEGISECNECWPSGDYAVSKLDAERRLIALSDEGILHNLIILRLAPVYDREWSLNLDRRVFAPGKLAYLRFGSGSQRMSALARPNLVDFIAFLIRTPKEYASLSQMSQLNRRNIEVERDKNSTPVPSSGATGQAGQGLRRFSQINIDRYQQITNTGNSKNNLCNQRNLRINVCDAKPYEFNTIIRVFKKSGVQPDRPVVSVPLSFVWLATRIAGTFLQDKRKWIHSCYDKLASDLVFDNEKMISTGFRPQHSLETIFSSTDYPSTIVPTYGAGTD